MSRAVIVPLDFNPVPSIGRTAAVRVSVTDTVPADADALGIPAGTAGMSPEMLGLGRAALPRSGFEGKAGQTLAIPSADGPLRVAVGMGDEKASDAAVRTAAASFARAAARSAHLALSLDGLAELPPDIAAQVAVEGILLARYAYNSLKSASTDTPVESITLITSAGQHEAAAAGAVRGHILARATMLARDLANTPPAHLTAVRLADVAAGMAAQYGLDVEIFDRDALVRLG